METISKSIRRFDFDDKVEGKAKYCADLHPEGMLYARTLRSDVPRAKIRAIRFRVRRYGVHSRVNRRDRQR